ncbi:hypothetical protein Tco_0497528 [Tanacetum coccineum]
MYHKKNVNYAYLLWEDFVYQVENKNVKKSNEMHYPRFTKVIDNFFMTKDQSILRQNNVNWHYARDDYMFTIIKYYAIASGAKPPKTKARVKKKQVGSDMSKTPPTKGKRLKTFAKAAKTAKKKQPAKTSNAKGLSVLSENSSEEDDDDEVNVSEDDDDDNDDDIDKDDEDDDADNQDDENPDDANQNDNDEQTESNNDGDDFVHPKLSIHDDEEESDDESNEDSDEEVQGAIIKEKEMDEEAIHEEDEANELYRDVNVNLEGRDTEMIDAPLPNVQGTQVTEDTHVIITASVNPEGQQQSSSVSSGFVSNMLNPSPDTGIDTIFTLKNEATSPVDVLVTTIAEPPLLSARTFPPPPTPLITHLQQTPVPGPATIPSSLLQDLPNFGSLFGFDHRLKTLETDFSEFKTTNQFAEAISSIPGIVDAYLVNKMHEAVKTAVQLQSKRLKDEAQAENADFLNKLNDNIKKIIKDQVKEQVKA